MKTEALVRKYASLLAPKLDCAVTEIEFQVRSQDDAWKTIGDLDYEKKDERFINHWCLGLYRVLYNNQTVASFELYQMPHCCGIMVSCRANVDSQWRSRGIGTLLNNLRQEIGRGLGYSVMMCTDVTTNEHQRKLLKTNGFKDIHTFLNRRTGNQVYVCVIGL